MEPGSVGGYAIVLEIGRGVAGPVFLARDTENDHDVALRVLDAIESLPEAERAAASNLVQRETTAAIGVPHASVAAVHETGQTDGISFIAMEHVEGASLDTFCAPGSLLDPDAIIAMIAEVADALHQVHAAGIVHGRIRPSKLRRVADRRVKLLDLGVTGFQSLVSSHLALLPSHPDYLAPEQVKGTAIDGRTDLFALSAVLFELLTGERPFRGDSVPSVLFRIVNEEPGELELHRSGVSTGLAGFIGKALAKRPEDRFQNGAAFATSLRIAHRDSPRLREGHAAAASSHPSLPPAPPEATPRLRRSPRAFIIAAIAVLAGVALIVALFAGRDRTPAPPSTFVVNVATEPEGIAVTWDGRPVIAGRVEVSASGPFGRLAATHGCRTTAHDVSAADAGRTVTLVLDPERAPVTVDAGVAGARLTLNGERAGQSPRRLELDLCRSNVFTAAAEGYSPTTVVVPAGATPMEATRALAALNLQPVPRGRLVLPARNVPLVLFVDGKRVKPAPGGLDVSAGEHDVRAVNEGLWIDVRESVTVDEGATATAELAIPPLSDLVVQAFPTNAKAFLRRGTGPWVYLDDVPVEKRIAVGAYQVRVEFIPTGETQEQEAVLRAGETAQLRFSFGTNR